MIIYKITNLLNNKIYIGQDKNNNPSYFGSGKAIMSAIKKYGKKYFIKEILSVCENVDDMNEKEIYWISFFNSTDKKIGYNISKGGKEGDRQTGYDITKQGVYNYWVDKYGEKEANIRLENKKEKLRKYNKKKKDEGWRHTEESLNKIRNASKNRKASQEAKEKMRKYRLGMKYSCETKKRMSDSKKDIGNKPILQFSKNNDFIKEWKSQTEIKEILKLKIWNALNGISKTCGGFKWKYKNNEEI